MTELVYLTSFLNSQSLMSDGPGTGKKKECENYAVHNKFIFSNNNITNKNIIKVFELVCGDRSR